MRRTVDDLRAWQDRKNASVRELQRRREEYEDRVVNTFTPSLSKGSRAIERGKKKIVVHSPGGKKQFQSVDSGRDSETLVDARLRMAHSGVGGVHGVQDAFSPEPEMRRPETAPQPTPLSMQVRGLRRGDDPALSIQRNVSDAFDGFMRRVGATAEALARDGRDEFPSEFLDQINWCRRHGAIDAAVAESLHRLRVWRNAATHHDKERWAREGPTGADEAARLIAEINTALAENQL